MTFEQAARAQHLRFSYYTVWLVSPTGERTRLGSTQRKNGTGLMNILRADSTQNRLKAMPVMDGATIKKTKSALTFSNGWKIEFGGTIRQEASLQEAKAEDEAAMRGYARGLLAEES